MTSQKDWHDPNFGCLKGWYEETALRDFVTSCSWCRISIDVVLCRWGTARHVWQKTNICSSWREWDIFLNVSHTDIGYINYYQRFLCFLFVFFSHIFVTITSIYIVFFWESPMGPRKIQPPKNHVKNMPRSGSDRFFSASVSQSICLFLVWRSLSPIAINFQHFSLNFRLLVWGWGHLTS